MKSLLLIPVLLITISCELTDAVKSVNKTPDKMDEMQEELKDTGEMLHKQVLVAALESMLDEHNTKDPKNPGKMTPGGEAFAKEATPEEIIKLTYVWLKDINGSTVSDLDIAEASTQSTEDAENLAHLRANHNKSVHLTGLQVIAGLAPQEKVEAIIRDQIERRGRYEETAYTFLVLRASFTQGYLLSEGVLQDKVINLGMANEALERLENLHYIKQQPLKERFVLKISGFLPVLDADGDEVEGLNFKAGLDDVISNDQMIKMFTQLSSDIETYIDLDELPKKERKQLENVLEKANSMSVLY